jgi:DNA-binding IclR family transcriptional regulator
MPSLTDEHLGRSAVNRSVIRGADILRAFKPGSDLLGNSDIAERTGLSPSTVSRLTQTLVLAGLLQADRKQRAYRLAPSVLSLGHAMRSGSRLLSVAAPRMRLLAESERVNVGLASPDRDEMVYLESIRYNRRVALRQVVSGQRVPMESTSLGRAYLASLTEARRRALLATIKPRHTGQWARLQSEIDEAVLSVRQHRYCVASWQPEVVAISTPISTHEGFYVMNLSLSTTLSCPEVARRYASKLLALADQTVGALAVHAPVDG